MSNNTTTTCEYAPNPDIAGLGVIVPLLVNAVMTMVTSILYWAFRNTRQLRRSLRSPIRRALMGLSFGLSLQQLVSGIALSVAIGTSPGWGIPDNLDPHWLLATVMNTFVAQTRLMTTGIILWDERPSYVTVIRGGMCFALALITSWQISNIRSVMGQKFSGVSAAIPWFVYFQVSLFGLCFIIHVHPYCDGPDEPHESPIFEHVPPTFAKLMGFSGPIFSLISFVDVIVIKFGPSIVNCNLNDPAENVLTFG